MWSCHDMLLPPKQWGQPILDWNLKTMSWKYISPLYNLIISGICYSYRKLTNINIKRFFSTILLFQLEVTGTLESGLWHCSELGTRPIKSFDLVALCSGQTTKGQEKRERKPVKKSLSTSPVFSLAQPDQAFQCQVTSVVELSVRYESVTLKIDTL
jgi:hypothetical protein